MNGKECLETAIRTVLANAENYGKAQDCFGRTAKLWSAAGFRRGGPISAEDVAVAMILLKIARQEQCSLDDNWVDIAGYAALGAEVG